MFVNVKIFLLKSAIWISGVSLRYHQEFSIVWSCIIFFKIFENMCKRKIGQKFLGSVLENFLKATLQLVGKWDGCLIDKLWTWVIEMANILAPSFKNLPNIFSLLGALFISSFFRSFKINWHWFNWHKLSIFL